MKTLSCTEPRTKNLDEALECIRGEEERKAELFARRQTALLRQHLRKICGADNIHCEDPTTYFFLNQKLGRSWLGFITIAPPRSRWLLVGGVGLGCGPNENFDPKLHAQLKDVNEQHRGGRLEYVNGCLQHRHEHLITRDLTEEEVGGFVVILCGVAPLVLEVIGSEFGLEDPDRFACRVREFYWSRPEKFDSTDLGADALTPNLADEDAPVPVGAIEVARDSQKDLLERFRDESFNHLLRTVGPAVEWCTDGGWERFVWMEEDVQYRLQAIIPAGPHVANPTHVSVLAMAFLGHVPTRYGEARRWVRERQGYNTVGLLECPGEIEGRLLSLQTTSVLRPGDGAGLDACLRDLRHEARSLLALLGVYHEIVPAPTALQMWAAMQNGDPVARRSWNDPRGVARELLRNGSAEELDHALELAEYGEAWQTVLGVLARKQKEALAGAKLPQGLLYVRARALFRLGRWRAGLRVAQSILEGATDDRGRACAFNTFAVGYHGLGQWDEALDVLRGVDARKIWRIHYHRALALLHLGRSEEAYKCIDEYFAAASGRDPYALREFQAAEARLEENQAIV